MLLAKEKTGDMNGVDILIVEVFPHSLFSLMLVDDSDSTDLRRGIR